MKVSIKLVGLVVGGTMMPCYQDKNSPKTSPLQQSLHFLESLSPFSSLVSEEQSTALNEQCEIITTLCKKFKDENLHLESKCRSLKFCLNSTNHQLQYLAGQTEDLWKDRDSIQKRYNDLLCTYIARECDIIRAQRHAKKVSKENKKLKRTLSSQQRRRKRRKRNNARRK